MNTLDALKWVTLATEKPSKRYRQHEYALTPHNVKGVTVAGDGFRLHIVNGEIPVTELVKFPNYTPILDRAKRGKIRGRISKYHLLKAAEACKVFAKDSANIMRLSLNGSLVASAKSCETGDARVEIIDGDLWNFVYFQSKAKTAKVMREVGDTAVYDNGWIKAKVVYTHEGEDLELAVNFNYLIDALQGLPDVIEYRMSDANSAIYLAGEVDGVLREAVVMPMHLSNANARQRG